MESSTGVPEDDEHEQEPERDRPSGYSAKGSGMLPKRIPLVFVLLVVLISHGSTAMAGPRWSEAQAREWYARQGFLVGANFVPATAINQLEMWQADTFDPARIDLELGWAAAIGMNTMRVFLHDLAYQQDPQGFLGRVDQFLTIAAKHGIRPMLVLFDSVWDPFPALGPQRPPRPGVHNSGWVQSPGKVALEDPSHWPRLEGYVTGVIGRFQDDGRVLAWDLWNEVDNPNEPAYSSLEPKNKGRARACAVAAGLRLGARRASHAAADERPVAWRRLVKAHRPARDRSRPAGALGHRHFPQLRSAAAARGAHPTAHGLQPADRLHGVHGARERQHV